MLYINIPSTLLDEQDIPGRFYPPKIAVMSAPATRRKRIAQFEISVREQSLVREDEGTADVEVSGYRLQHIPLGILHVNSEWKVLEYRDYDDQALPVTSALGKHLFAIAPWIRHPDFVQTLNAAIRSGVANSHFDFHVSMKSMERAIHVNIMVLGDTTAWLFISDKSLPL